jgi:hypothetical protein
MAGISSPVDPYWREVIEEHLPYELDMMVGGFRRLEAGVDDVVIRNALINSLAVQVRNLIDFLVQRSSSVTWDYGPFAVRQIDESILNKINDQITHLDVGRKAHSDDKLGQGDFVTALGVLFPELMDFRDRLRPEYLALTDWEVIPLPTSYLFRRRVPVLDPPSTMLPRSARDYWTYGSFPVPSPQPTFPGSGSCLPPSNR